MDPQKLSFQIGSAQFAAEGAEAFIWKALSEWKALIEKPELAQSAVQSAQTHIPQGSKAQGAQAGLTQYENVFDEADGLLKIIAHINGKNNADRTRDVALVLLYGHYIRGQDTVAADAIRQACQDQGCLDSSNFAAHLKGLKEKVVMNTKQGGGYDVKLTAPGRKAAKELVESINNAG